VSRTIAGLNKLTARPELNPDINLHIIDKFYRLNVVKGTGFSNKRITSENPPKPGKNLATKEKPLTKYFVSG
jgi:hypothetical protein